VHPAYALRNQPPQSGSTGTPTEPTKYKVVEENQRKDRVAQSVVSFVHLRHSTFHFWGISPALSFGLGVEPSRAGDYYPGISFMFGDRAALSGGVVIGQVPTLPAGRQLGDEVTDVNSLATLGSQKRTSWFVGLSYQFLGGGANDLKKPFQGQSPPSSTTSPAQTPASDGAAVRQPSSAAAGPALTFAGDSVLDVKPGAESAPLGIRGLPGLTVGWSWEPQLAGVNTVSALVTVGADSLATTKIRVPAAFADSLNVRAKVCDTSGKCSDKMFVLRAKP
jgi:hypothetical protein